MKLFNLTLALAFSITLAVGMGSKSKPSTPIEAQKVLPESTRASDHDPVELIEDAAEDNQKVEQHLDKSTAYSGNLPGSKKAKKTKQVAKKKKAKSVKKSAKKPAKKALKAVEIK
jgi:hypothetical protein